MASERDWIQEFREVGKYQHRFRYDYNMRDIHNYYASKFDKKLDYKRFKEICVLFNKKLADKIITESFEFKMPYRAGNIRIKSEKKSIKFKDGKIDVAATGIDWPSSHKMWKEMYPEKTYKEIMATPNKKVLVYTNDHSNGYIMRWYWDRRLSNMKNQSLYIFKPVKGIQDKEYYNEDNRPLYFGKRGLASWIKSDERVNEYFE